MATPKPHFAPPIGWDGRTLKAMLEDAEALLTTTGRYCGVETLTLKDDDPIAYETSFAKLRGGLVAARERALSISASPIVREVGELCFALYTPEGDAVTLSTGIIVHVHTMSDAIKFMIRNDYETNPGIRSGDVFCNNDPMIGDVQNADVQTIVPIFWGDELLGWAGGVTHELDIGAVVPGSSPVGPTSRHGDGLSLPCTKIGSDDRIWRDHEIRCALSVRTPSYWLLDERTRLVGCHLVRRSVQQLIGEIGIDTYRRLVREVIEEGRRSFLQRVRERLVPGTYRAPSFVDVPWADEDGIPVQARKDTLMHAPLTLEIRRDGGFKVSFDGASGWGLHSFNCSTSAMQGALFVLLTQTIIPNDKVNDGAYLATEHDFPLGSFANPGTHLVSTSEAWHFLMPAFQGLVRSLSRAQYSRGYVEEISAGYALTFNSMQGGGTDHYGEQTAFISAEDAAVGGGAGVVRDGLDYGAAMWNPEGDMGDIEAWEIVEPLLSLGRRVKPSSAGHGRFRGGSGYESARMVWGTNDFVLYHEGEGYVFGNCGLYGGYPGATGYRRDVHGTNIRDLISQRKPYPSADGDPDDSELEALLDGEFVVEKKAMNLPEPFVEGDFYLQYLRGGPGCGDPLERDPELVARDLADGFLLPRFAGAVYGVVVRDDLSVDAEATQERRDELRARRVEAAVPTADYLTAERQRILEHRLIEPVRAMYRESDALSPTWRRFYREFWSLPDDFEL